MAFAPSSAISSEEIVPNAASASSKRHDAASQRTSMSRLCGDWVSASNRSARPTHAELVSPRGTSPTSRKASSRSSKRTETMPPSSWALSSMAWRSVLRNAITGSASPAENAARASSTCPSKSREGIRDVGRLVSRRARPPTSSCSILINATRP